MSTAIDSPCISQIGVFPIKSFDAVSLSSAFVRQNGALDFDRRWRIVRSGEGSGAPTVVNGKREKKLLRLRACYEICDEAVRVGLLPALEMNSIVEAEQVFVLGEDDTQLAEYLSEYFSYSVRLESGGEQGFPDDPDSGGPTIISTPTIREIASWFGYPENEVRRRLRANIEIDGPNLPAFWEDRLFAEQGSTKPFWIDQVMFLGDHPCDRCGVPASDSRTGEASVGFQKHFLAKRSATLPDWTEKSWFTNAYRASVRTQIPESEWGKEIAIGDLVHFGQS